MEWFKIWVLESAYNRFTRNVCDLEQVNLELSFITCEMKY